MIRSTAFVARLYLAVCFALVAGSFAASQAWPVRRLLVIAPDGDDQRLARQRAMLAPARGGLIERDVQLLFVAGDHLQADYGSPTALSAAALRRRYGGGLRFRVVLIGKDGGVKWISAEPTPPRVLFELIDAMPMRRDEMRAQKARSAAR